MRYIIIALGVAVAANAQITSLSSQKFDISFQAPPGWAIANVDSSNGFDLLFSVSRAGGPVFDVRASRSAPHLFGYKRSLANMKVMAEGRQVLGIQPVLSALLDSSSGQETHLGFVFAYTTKNGKDMYYQWASVAKNSTELQNLIEASFIVDKVAWESDAQIDSVLAGLKFYSPGAAKIAAKASPPLRKLNPTVDALGRPAPGPAPLVKLPGRK